MDIVIRFNNAMERVRAVREAIQILNGCQSYFNYIPEELDAHQLRMQLCLREGSESLRWEEITEGLGGCLLHGIPAVYVIDTPFEDNWFSHESAEFAVITTADWERIYSPPTLQAYIAYQVAQASVSSLLGLTEEMELRLAHVASNGCMFDLCLNKMEIKLGMSAGVICPSCKASLRQYGMHDDAITACERILRYVRSNAIGMTELVDYDRAFVVIRNSYNDENDHAYKYGIEPALNDVGIMPLVAVEQPPEGLILARIREGIRGSRFVVAKVDEQNLNVYFELGYAMALDKDVLLIAERSLVGQLPVDINNWSCLTYTKGDYEQLRESIVRFFREKYHRALVENNEAY